MQVGFIGTGTMGNPMARCLFDAGFQVTVHDIRRAVTTNLAIFVACAVLNLSSEECRARLQQ